MKPIGVLDEREILVLDMRKKGKSYAEIGRDIGVSRSQAKVVAEIAWRKKTTQAEGKNHRAHMFLSTRSYNALRYNGINIADEDAHIKVSKMKEKDLLEFPNFSKKSLSEIHLWMEANGLSIACDPQPEKPRQLCPHCSKHI